MLLCFAFLLFSLYNMSLLCVKFNEEKKKIKWKTKERERKSTRDQREKKRRKKYKKEEDKEEDQEKEARRRRRRDICTYMYKSAQHRVRDALESRSMILPGKMHHREYRENIRSRVKKKKRLEAKRRTFLLQTIHARKDYGEARGRRSKMDRGRTKRRRERPRVALGGEGLQRMDESFFRV